MSFLDKFFDKKERSGSAVLIDIGTDSVAGACVRYIKGEPATILYTRRLPIEIRVDEPHERAMLRALEVLGSALIREGAPALLRHTGSGTADTVLVSVDAPWQKTNIRNEYFEEKNQFTFTKRMVEQVLDKTRGAYQDKLIINESVIGAIINGYETRDPYGKKAHRASVIILTSLIDEKVAKNIHTILRKLYHSENILLIAGSSLRYQAMRIAFPHDRAALILDATTSFTSVSLVRQNLLVDIVDIPAPIADPTVWLKNITGALSELARRFPLPRTIFLLAQEQNAVVLQEIFSTMHSNSLWLSDNPPSIIFVKSSHIGNLVRQATTTVPDLPLLLMALYFGRRSSIMEM